MTLAAPVTNSLPRPRPAPRDPADNQRRGLCSHFKPQTLSVSNILRQAQLPDRTPRARASALSVAGEMNVAANV